MAHVVLIFDSVQNTVFYDQVFKNLVEKAKRGLEKCFLITFEKDPIQAKRFFNSNFNNLPNNLEIIFFERMPFLGRWSLDFAANKLKKFFIDERFYQKKINVFCRGTFAAYIFQKAVEKVNQEFDSEGLASMQKKQKRLFIKQAILSYPGIASQEVLLYGTNSLWSKAKSWLQGLLISRFESHFFSNKQPFWNKVLVYSQAMKSYLVSEFGLSACCIEVEASSLTTSYKTSDKLQARQNLRSKIAISQDRIIYCFSGGMQPWQNFELNLIKFQQEAEKNDLAFLLVLTTSPEQANAEIAKFGLSNDLYKVLQVPSAEVEQILLGCDFGLLCREANLVNWTAKPIKATQYLKAGLLVMHNSSVQWVSQNA